MNLPNIKYLIDEGFVTFEYIEVGKNEEGTTIYNINVHWDSSKYPLEIVVHQNTLLCIRYINSNLLYPIPPVNGEGGLHSY